jgi:acylglycerol lipase
MNASEEGQLEGVGGLSIFWQCWLPQGRPRVVLVLAHGLSEHSTRYAHVAARLVSEGIAVYGLDHRGHGRSEGSRALIDRMDHAVADLDQLVSIARERQAGLPLFLLGHSMGGCVALSYSLVHQDRLDGLLLSGPVAALEAAPALARGIASLLSRVSPRLGVLQLDASLVSRDPDVVRDYEEDPLNYHGKVPARTVTELAGAVDSFEQEVPRLTLPILLMHGTEDGLAPIAGSEMVERVAGSDDKRLIRYEGLYHEILNEPEQDRVMDDMVAWIAEHAGQRAAAG